MGTLVPGYLRVYVPRDLRARRLHVLAWQQGVGAPAQDASQGRGMGSSSRCHRATPLPIPDTHGHIPEKTGRLAKGSSHRLFLETY